MNNSKSSRIRASEIQAAFHRDGGLSNYVIESWLFQCATLRSRGLNRHQVAVDENVLFSFPRYVDSKLGDGKFDAALAAHQVEKDKQRASAERRAQKHKLANHQRVASFTTAQRVAA